jgi:hypothetical protein
MASTMNILKTLTSPRITLGMQAYTQLCNKFNINISLMWSDRYLKNALHLDFRNNVDVVRVLVENFVD